MPNLALRCNNERQKSIIDKTAKVFIFLIDSNCSESVISCQNVQKMVRILPN